MPDTVACGTNIVAVTGGTNTTFKKATGRFPSALARRIRCAETSDGLAHAESICALQRHYRQPRKPRAERLAGSRSLPDRLHHSLSRQAILLVVRPGVGPRAGRRSTIGADAC